MADTRGTRYSADLAGELVVLGRPRLDRAGDELAFLLVHRIVDGVTTAGVEDLDAEDLHGRRSTVLVGTGNGDVEGQELVVVPGIGQLVGRIQVALDGVQLVDSRAHGRAEGAHDRGGEDGLLGG